ncbi:hypothetical protein PTKIN_Ptkin10aG0017400 [Pterospermum kingtungense]
MPLSLSRHRLRLFLLYTLKERDCSHVGLLGSSYRSAFESHFGFFILDIGYGNSNDIGDELLSDSFPYKEIENEMLWEVEGKCVVQGAIDVNIGANPSAEGADEDEGVDEQAVKVVDIVDTFRLQEQPAFYKKQFITYIKRFIKNLSSKLDEEKAEIFKKHIERATKFLLSKLKDLQFFVGESMHDDGCLVFAYYKDGAVDPTFLYFVYALKEVKC